MCYLIAARIHSGGRAPADPLCLFLSPFLCFSLFAVFVSVWFLVFGFLFLFYFGSLVVFFLFVSLSFDVIYFLSVPLFFPYILCLSHDVCLSLCFSLPLSCFCFCYFRLLVGVFLSLLLFLFYFSCFPLFLYWLTLIDFIVSLGVRV